MCVTQRVAQHAPHRGAKSPHTPPALLPTHHTHTHTHTPPPPQEELDRRLLVQLRDGRTLLGTLRSFDQFANLVLEAAVERVTSGSSYADVPLGVHVLRGENVVLMGRVDDGDAPPPGMTRGVAKDVKAAKTAEKEAERVKKTLRARFDFLGDDF